MELLNIKHKVIFFGVSKTFLYFIKIRKNLELPNVKHFVIFLEVSEVSLYFTRVTK